MTFDKFFENLLVTFFTSEFLFKVFSLCFVVGMTYVSFRTVQKWGQYIHDRRHNADR